jgi:tetratricopeptide (TPR) repeat protein
MLVEGVGVMKSLISLFQMTLFVVFICFAAPSVRSENYSLVVNSIEGIVWDPYRRPAANLYVELQNENYFSLRRVRTTGTGRFTFTGLTAGRYNIKVLTSGTNYQEATETIEIVNVIRNTSDTAFLDIYLKFDKRRLNSGLTELTGAVFVQNIPAEARKLYSQGVSHINDKGDKGFLEIEEALKIFPDYYDALNTLGTEYVARKEYQKALPYLIRSIDINRRSFTSFYALAYACFQLNHRPEALEAARAATVLQGNSLNAQLLYGTLLRMDRSYEKALQALLAAKKLIKDFPVAEVHWQLALLYNRLGRNKEAADELQAYLSIQPEARDRKEIQDLIAKLRKNPNLKP